MNAKLDQKPFQERARELVSLLMPSWHPTTIQVLWAIRITIVLGVAVAIGYAYGITLWDWLKLLIVPAVIAAGGVWFNHEQQTRAQESADQRFKDETLQAYIVQISELLRDKERPLGEAQPNDTVSRVALQLTRAVLTRIDGRRRGQALQFLYETDLITRGRTVINLWGLNLREAHLATLVLTRADLRGAQLDRADLRLSVLRHADLRRADLNEAGLRWADLADADLRETILFGADLTGASIKDIRQLSPDRLGARVAVDRVTGRATALKDTTMPNGQKYEDWLKTPEGQKYLNDKEGLGEDTEDSSAS